MLPPLPSRHYAPPRRPRTWPRRDGPLWISFNSTGTYLLRTSAKGCLVPPLTAPLGQTADPSKVSSNYNPLHA
eukprot:6209336-Pleurochrysis_carterae.AAC.2